MTKTPRLRGDLYGLFGIRGNTMESYRVYEIEKKNLDRLRGVRCDWMLLFEEPDQETLEYLIPMLVAGSSSEIEAAQHGEPITTTPVIYYASPMKRLYPTNL